MLLPDLLLLFLPVHTEGRIGEEVVEGLTLELVLGEAVAVPDVVADTVVVTCFISMSDAAVAKARLL